MYLLTYLQIHTSRTHRHTLHTQTNIHSSYQSSTPKINSIDITTHVDMQPIYRATQKIRVVGHGESKIGAGLLLLYAKRRRIYRIFFTVRFFL